MSSASVGRVKMPVAQHLFVAQISAFCSASTEKKTNFADWRCSFCWGCFHKCIFMSSFFDPAELLNRTSLLHFLLVARALSKCV